MLKSFILLSICWTSFAFGQINLKLRPITQSQFEEASKIIAEINYLDFNDLGNCEVRALWMVWELKVRQIPASSMTIMGNNLTNDWFYHVAAVVEVEGMPEPMVFDRGISKDGPIALSQWLSIVVVSGKFTLSGGYSDTIQLSVLSHFCSEIENKEGNLIIDSLDDLDLSENTRRILLDLEKQGKIIKDIDEFTCTDQGYEWT